MLQLTESISMPNLQVLSCPSCGASLPVTGNEAEVTCQFCGNEVRLEPGVQPRAVSIAPKAPSLPSAPAPWAFSYPAVIVAVFFVSLGLIFFICFAFIAAYYTYYSFSTFTSSLLPARALNGTAVPSAIAANIVGSLAATRLPGHSFLSAT